MAYIVCYLESFHYHITTIFELEMNELKIKDFTNPLPKEAVKQHPTKTYLSSIKAVYVTERFTELFGVGGWTTKVQEVSHNSSSGMVVVKVTFEVPKHSIYYECYGGNDNGGANSKNFDLGDAYKGATTDALTKIGSYLGVGIDVFKGLNDSPKKEYEKDNIPVVWLTETQANKAIQDGKVKQALDYYDSKTVRDGKKYCMSKVLKTKLQAEV